MKIVKKLYNAMPPYGWICAILMTSWNFLVYFGSRVFTTGLYHHDIETDLDRALPFIPAFVIIYIFGSYAQWIYGYYIVLREDRVTAVRVAKAEIIAGIICLVCFLVIPTTMVRHDLTDTDLLSRWVQSVYDMDPADNLFPSIHCLESYILTRAAFSKKIGMERCPAWFKWLSIPVTALVFASTLYLRQHVFVDVVSAVVVVEIGIFIACRVVKERKDC